MKQNFTVRQGALDGVEAFLSVARHRSFRKAAAELGVTPSAISQAVRTLEARVGAALFIRTTRSVGLTEAGERFRARAKPAFEELVGSHGGLGGWQNHPFLLYPSDCPPSCAPMTGAEAVHAVIGPWVDQAGDEREPQAHAQNPDGRGHSGPERCLAHRIRVLARRESFPTGAGLIASPGAKKKSRSPEVAQVH